MANEDFNQGFILGFIYGRQGIMGSGKAPQDTGIFFSRTNLERSPFYKNREQLTKSNVNILEFSSEYGMRVGGAFGSNSYLSDREYGILLKNKIHMHIEGKRETSNGYKHTWFGLTTKDSRPNKVTLDSGTIYTDIGDFVLDFDIDTRQYAGQTLYPILSWIASIIRIEEWTYEIS